MFSGTKNAAVPYTTTEVASFANAQLKGTAYEVREGTKLQEFLHGPKVGPGVVIIYETGGTFAMHLVGVLDTSSRWKLDVYGSGNIKPMEKLAKALKKKYKQEVPVELVSQSEG
jgi:hypothetical protein